MITPKDPPDMVKAMQEIQSTLEQIMLNVGKKLDLEDKSLIYKDFNAFAKAMQQHEHPCTSFFRFLMTLVTNQGPDAMCGMLSQAIHNLEERSKKEDDKIIRLDRIVPGKKL